MNSAPTMTDATAPRGDEPKTASSRRWKLWVLGGGALVLVALLLAAGAGGWWLANRTLIANTQNTTEETEPTTVLSGGLAMPDVRGLTQDEAAQVLADSGFSAAIISFVDAPSGAPEGIIVTQTPSFGTTAPNEIVLGVAVPATMPDLTGKSRDDAVTALSDLGVAAAIELTYAPDVDAGTVVSTVPVTGEALGETATIRLASAGVGVPLLDVRRLSGNCSGSGKASLGGVEFTTSVQCRADDEPRETVWFLQGRADEFTATVGVDDTAAPGSSVTVEFLVDGAQVFSKTITFARPEEVTIPTAGVLQLAVRVSAADDATVVLGAATVRGSAEAITGITQ